MKTHTLALGAVAGLVLASASAGAAVDPKQYPGSQCKAVLTGGQYTVDFGDIFNTATTTLNVTCPLVKDNGSTSTATAKVKVFDRHSSKNFSCTMFAESASGSFVTSDSQTKGTSEQFQPGFWSTDLATIEMPAVAAGFDYNYLECHVPGVTSNGFSHLVTIDISES